MFFFLFVCGVYSVYEKSLEKSLLMLFRFLIYSWTHTLLLQLLQTCPHCAAEFFMTVMKQTLLLFFHTRDTLFLYYRQPYIITIRFGCNTALEDRDGLMFCSWSLQYLSIKSTVCVCMCLFRGGLAASVPSGFSLAISADNLSLFDHAHPHKHTLTL